MFNYLNQYSGLLTFIVTAIYAFTTYCILKANQKSADGAFEQVEESKRQFEESKRLEYMPFLQIEHSAKPTFTEFELELPVYANEPTRLIQKYIKLRNVGNGTATNITYSWYCDNLGVRKSGYPEINAIMSGNCYNVLLDFLYDESLSGKIPTYIEFNYQDIIGHDYTQKIIMYFENDDLTRIENNPPLFEETVKYSVIEEQNND